LRVCVPLDLHIRRTASVDDIGDRNSKVDDDVTQQQLSAAPRLTVWNGEEIQTDAGAESPHSGVPSIDESSSSSECDRYQTESRHCLAQPVLATSLLADGRYRRRRKVRSSSTSSASSSSISPPPATSGTASRAKYACDECDRRYATSSNLSRHKQTHRSVDGEHARPCPNMPDHVLTAAKSTSRCLRCRCIFSHMI